MTTLHDEIFALAGDNPAAYISHRLFSKVVLNRLTSTISRLKDLEIPAGSGKFSACLSSVDWFTQPSTKLSPVSASGNPIDSVDLLINSDFAVHINIFVAGKRAAVVSNVEIKVKSARCHLSAEQNVVTLGGVDFDFDRSITRTADAARIFAAEGLDELEAAHLEGHIGYGVATQAITSALSAKLDIPLADLFPSIDFGLGITLHVLSNGQYLGIVSSGNSVVNQSDMCECKDGKFVEISRSEIILTTPPDPKPKAELGSVTIGGPIAEGKNPLTDFGPRVQAENGGESGIYIPKVFAQKMLLQVMPAIKARASDSGTIGYSAEASVGFENLRLSFDAASGGLLVDIDLDISVSAYCDLEVFKGFRLPIGWAIVEPTNSSKASLQIGFYPCIGDDLSVRLRSAITKADMGSYVAVVIGIGTALKIFGVTAWIGFLVDVVLATILSVGLPIALKASIGKYMANREWKLVDGAVVAGAVGRGYKAATYSIKNESLLASYLYDPAG